MARPSAFNAGYNAFLTGIVKKAVAVNPYMYSPRTNQFAGGNPWTNKGSIASQFSTFNSGLPTVGKPVINPAEDAWTEWKNNAANRFLEYSNNNARYDWLTKNISSLPQNQRADALSTITSMPVDLNAGNPVHGNLYDSSTLPGPEAFDSREALRWAYDRDTRNGVGFNSKYNTENDMFGDGGVLKDGIPQWDVVGGGQDGGKYFNDSVAGGEKFESPLEYAKAWELQNWEQQRNALTDDQKFQAKFNEITGIDTLPKKYKPVGEPDKAGYIGGRNAADQYNGTLESAQNREKWFNDNFENIARLGDTPQDTLATRKAQQQNLGIRAGDDADAFAKSQVAQDRYGSDVDAAKSDYYASKGIKWVPADVHFRANGAIAKQPATAASPMFNTGKSVGRKPGYRGTV